jgi:cytoskeletal protein RodZ
VVTKARSVRMTAGMVLWLAAAAAATAAGLFAVGAIGTDIFGASAQEPLSQSEVDEQLAESGRQSEPPGSSTSAAPTSSPTTPSTSTPTRTTSASPTTRTTNPAPPPAKPSVVHSAGGTVLARCAPGGVEVLGATPAQGFQVESDDDGIDDHPKITFVTGEREIEVRLRCTGGRVTHTVEEKN